MCPVANPTISIMMIKLAKIMIIMFLTRWALHDISTCFIPYTGGVKGVAGEIRYLTSS